MTRGSPPEWGDDHFSTFFKDADYNTKACAANYPQVFQALGRVHALFRAAVEAVEKDSNFLRLVPRLLLVRVHSGFLAAIRLTMSGQSSESYPVLRASVEQSWYALHMAIGDDADRRTNLWLKRNETPKDTSACKAEFTVRNVRTTHEQLDTSGATQLLALYEKFIDFGGHPNQMGVFSNITSDESDTAISFQVGILHPAELQSLAALRLAMATAIGGLKIFNLIYPERFQLIGLDVAIQRLVVDLNSVFRAFGSQKRPKDEK